SKEIRYRKDFELLVASVKGYSKKMDVYYLYFSIFYFLQKRKDKKTENSIKIRATLVITFRKHISCVDSVPPKD
ncbi:hypothetical protein LSPCS325_25710, partial [Lysinibacillus sp. CTST325]